ncbi:hypothetical protein HGRIS_008689 [Hohenbuehelia grisea]|uniref:Uncharacterized protein n=1 Tax=Hohenbuehelia grisea TaxID=104357 RepID=A0ABR3J8R8_9AGAR
MLITRCPETLYAGIDPSTQSANTQTGYKWSFASRQTKSDVNAVRAAREEVGAATSLREPSSYPGPASASGSGRMQGPSLPSASDLQLVRESESDYRDAERSYKRKRDKMEAKERVEDMVGPKEVGREGMLEKKRAKRENDRAFREKGDEGLEVDETTLMGGGDSFRAAIARRDGAKSRRQQKAEEDAHAHRERTHAYKEKEKATMDMLQQLAKQRFG